MNFSQILGKNRRSGLYSGATCSPENTVPPYQVTSWSIQPFGHNRHGLRFIRTQACLLTVNCKSGGLLSAVPLSIGDLYGHLTQCRLGQGLPLYEVASWCIQPFGHNRHGLKSGGAAVPFGGRKLGPHLTQCGLGRGLPPYQEASWSIQLFGYNTPTFALSRWTNNPNSKSIGSAVFAQLAAGSAYTLQWVPLSTRIAPSNGGSGPHVIHGSLGPPEFWTQTTTRSLQSFLQSSPVWQTDKTTDHATRSVTIGCMYVLHTK